MKESFAVTSHGVPRYLPSYRVLPRGHRFATTKFDPGLSERLAGDDAGAKAVSVDFVAAMIAEGKTVWIDPCENGVFVGVYADCGATHSTAYAKDVPSAMAKAVVFGVGKSDDEDQRRLFG